MRDEVSDPSTQHFRGDPVIHAMSTSTVDACTNVHTSRAMTRTPFHADPKLSLHQARQAFFRDAGFEPDGGYDAPWQDADFGPWPYRVPNPPARAQAMRVHDLHHLATGYGTDWRGEAEISAWELGSGGAGRLGYAWIIALWGLFTGLVAAPRRVFRAFVRGRGSRNLYATGVTPALLQARVGQLRRELAVQPDRAGQADPWAPGTPERFRWTDRLAFAGWGLAAAGWGLTGGLAVVALVAARGGQQLRQLWRCPLGCSPTAGA